MHDRPEDRLPRQLDLFPPTPQPISDQRPAASGSLPGVRGVIGIAVLSAILASVSTFTLLSTVGGIPPLSIEPVATAVPEVAQPAATTNTQPTSLTDIIATARDSVVTITSEGMSGSPFSPFEIPTSGVGSGIVVSTDGLILTNNHVVEGADRLSVTTADGQTLEATVVTTDPDHDMAVIQASGGDLAAAALGDSDAIEVGQTVLAIGSPLGEFTETVTRGIVSALGREITVGDENGFGQKTLSDLVQTDAAINPGNSGGPLINDSGEVVGMNTAVSRSAEGIGFAIPINAAKALIDEAAATVA
ncbi:MAG: S1C family serine protease [Aeromicrobium sp.]